MNSLLKLWEIILESNTFNFIVLIVIFAIVLQKIKITDKITAMKDSIIEKLEASEKAKTDARQKYKDAKDKIVNLDEEILEKLNIAQIQADNVAKTIQETADRKLRQLHNNVDKIIEAEEKTIFTTLNDKTAEASVDMAEEFIIEKLEQEPELQEKYIEEAIKELEKAVF